jgi:flagellar assembly factor FliW
MIMKVASLALGEIEVKSDDVYTFANGLAGFEEYRQFVIVQPDPNVPFSYLQSVEESSLSLLVANPFIFFPDYDFELADSAVEALNVMKREDVTVWTVITLGKSIADTTANLLAPLVLNTKERLGRQIILHQKQYQTKHKLFSDSPSEKVRG